MTGDSGEQPTQDLTIFINYRRDDKVDAGRLSDRLKHRFGKDHVFFDVEEERGLDWLKEIKTRGGAASVVLCLIGKDWLETLRARATPALRGRPDYARQEIEWALSDWRGRVIPILMDTRMPDKYDLPRSLRGLCARNAIDIGVTSFDRDVAELIEQIKEGSGAPSAAAPVSETTAVPVAPRRRARRPVTIPAPTDDHYEEVVDEMLDGWVVVFLGPSVRGSLPDSAYLAASLAHEYGLPAGASDLAEVAQRILLIEGDDKLYGSIRRTLAAASRPMPVHEFLAGFPRLLRRHDLPPAPQVIISTNYDWALEQAFEDASEPFDYAVYMAASGRFVHYPWGDRDGEARIEAIDEPRVYDKFPIGEDVHRTVIVKVHGSVDGEDPLLAEPNSYLVTEDHYLKFLHSQEINDYIPTQILERIQRRKCLFLGYTLKDWNARLLLKRIWQRKNLTNRSWAVEDDPDELELLTWRTIGNVDLLSCDITEYVTRLQSVLTARSAGAPAVPGS
jgi:hypothetical protein